MATEPDKTLQIDQYNVIQVPGDGWCFYTSVIAARMLLESNTIPNLSDAKFQPLALKTAEGISKSLLDVVSKDADFRSTIQIMLDDRDIKDKDPEQLKKALEKIDANPNAQNDAILKKTLIEAAKEAYAGTNVGPYLRDNQGKPFASVEDYITKMGLPVDPKDLSRGPVAWPDVGLIGMFMAKFADLNISIYQQEGGKYNLLQTYTTDPPKDVGIKLIYVGRNHYDILAHKESTTDAKAMQTGVQAGVQAGVHTLSKPSSKFLDKLQSIKSKLKGFFMKKELAKTATGVKIFKQEIIIAGERVRLQDAGFDPSKYNDVVGFTQAYFPGQDNLDGARSIFSRVFSRDIFNSNSVFRPPCDDDDMKILISGLNNRLDTLNTEMQGLRTAVGDNVRIRAKLELYERIRILIEELVESFENKMCQEYNADGSSAGFKTVNFELDNQVRDLLRQFAFMTLQAKMPVKKFDYITRDAKEMVAMLNNIKISKDDMDAYIKTWNEQASQMDPPQAIPNIIAEVLDATDNTIGLVGKLVEDELGSIYTQVVESARLEYGIRGDTEPVPAILTEFNEYVKGLEATVKDHKTRFLEIVKWILKKNKTCLDDLATAQQKERDTVEDLTQKTAELNKSNAELGAASHNLSLLESQKAATVTPATPATPATPVDKPVSQIEAELKANKAAVAIILEKLQAENKALQAAVGATTLSQKDTARAEHAAAAANSATVATENALAAKKALAAQNELVAKKITQKGGAMIQDALVKKEEYHTDVLNNLANNAAKELTAVSNTAQAASNRADNAEQQNTQLESQLQTLKATVNQMQKQMNEKDAGTQDMINSLRNMGQNIMAGNQYTIPQNIAPNAGNAFKQLYGQIMTRVAPPSLSVVSNATCFLNYFVTFFMKTIFFSQTMTEQRQRIKDVFDTITNNIIIKVQQIMPSSPQKDVLYAIVNTSFNLLETAQTLFINNETSQGTPTEYGLQVIKSDKLNPTSIAILKIIYVEFYQQATPSFVDDMAFMEKIIFEDLLMRNPSVYFNPPMDLEYNGDILQAGKDLVSYPSMVYMPSDYSVNIPAADLIQKLDGMNDTFQITQKGTSQKFNVSQIVADPAAQKIWSDAIFLKLQDATLQYTTLFISFIVFSRKYLLLIKDDLKACSLSSFLAKPSLGS